MKILHLSFHKGCQNDIQYICYKLNYDLEFMKFTDGYTTDNNNDIYNITHQKAIDAWNNYKDYYNKFDIIITSDTAPISRVFLQNGWNKDNNKKLIIWICNRFDYSHGFSSEFPDNEYYDLFRIAINSKNVYIIGYTPIEIFYANNIRNVLLNDIVIKPIGNNINYCNNYNQLINYIQPINSLFIIPYHNENIMMNLEETLNNYNIPCYKSNTNKYDGAIDLLKYKGVIHIPYAWSNLALFEGIQLGIIYFIPDFNFLMQIKKNKNFWFQDYYLIEKYNCHNLCEWYAEEHSNIFIYFSSWEDLQYKFNNIDIDKQKSIIKEFAIKHENKYLDMWDKIIRN